MTALVCVVVLVCDRTQFLREALDSVARQTFRDFEVVVSDGSRKTENSAVIAAIVQAVREDFPDLRLALIRQSKPMKQATHQSAVIGSTASTYIALLDDDDFWFEEHLRRSIEWLSQAEGHGLTTSNSLVIDAQGKTLGTASDEKMPVPAEADPKGWLNLVLRSWYGSTSGLVVRRTALRQHSFFETPIVDVHMIISTLLAGYLVKGFQRPSFAYRVHNDSFYAKGVHLILDRHELRRRLWMEHGLRLFVAAPIFPLLLLKSIFEPFLIRRRLHRSRTKLG